MHHWQDIVLSIGAVIFSVALIPSILSKHKPALSTSTLTAVILAIFTFVYATLDLWFTSFAVGINCLAWSTLAIQKYMQTSAHNHHKTGHDL